MRWAYFLITAMPLPISTPKFFGYLNRIPPFAFLDHFHFFVSLSFFNRHLKCKAIKLFVDPFLDLNLVGIKASLKKRHDLNADIIIMKVTGGV